MIGLVEATVVGAKLGVKAYGLWAKGPSWIKSTYDTYNVYNDSSMNGVRFTPMLFAPECYISFPWSEEGAGLWVYE